MPRSKRQKIVSLTKTEAKGKEHKEKLIDTIKECCDKYEYIWVYSVKNMRNAYLKNVRNKLKTSRFFYGRNKVMVKALGSEKESEYKQNISSLSKKLVGEVGLFFTSESPESITEYFDELREYDYARSGFLCPHTISIKQGELVKGTEFLKRYLDTEHNTDEMTIDADENSKEENGENGYVERFPPNMESQLRDLGLPTELVKGKVHLTNDFQLCTKGQTLTPQQAQLLKLFDVKLAPFKVDLVCYWNNGNIVEM
ncbi:hypothetical protein BB559_000804 [Furculomyces boomerangus]|uniref:Ribosome assembly factor mrt4 n=2 Tax=Harpellales TaxID=61421 RepID=A0A2T9Z457_9FUNG|nr:hypothetical protein BB559_000804 [Furculomyces boomerangus]PVZ98675.1 hypothetical protein BB558_005316 [Smittium angustum]